LRGGIEESGALTVQTLGSRRASVYNDTKNCPFPGPTWWLSLSDFRGHVGFVRVRAWEYVGGVAVSAEK